LFQKQHSQLAGQLDAAICMFLANICKTACFKSYLFLKVALCVLL